MVHSFNAKVKKRAAGLENSVINVRSVIDHDGRHEGLCLYGR